MVRTAVIAESSVYLGNILEVKDKKQQVTLEIILRFYWTDKRITPIEEFLSGEDPVGSYVNVDPLIVNDIWIPDAYIDEVLTIRTPKYERQPASLRYVNICRQKGKDGLSV